METAQQPSKTRIPLEIRGGKIRHYWVKNPDNYILNKQTNAYIRIDSKKRTKIYTLYGEFPASGEDLKYLWTQFSANKYFPRTMFINEEMKLQRYALVGKKTGKAPIPKKHKVSLEVEVAYKERDSTEKMKLFFITKKRTKFRTAKRKLMDELKKKLKTISDSMTIIEMSNPVIYSERIIELPKKVQSDFDEGKQFFMKLLEETKKKEEERRERRRINMMPRKD